MFTEERDNIPPKMMLPLVYFKNATKIVAIDIATTYKVASASLIPNENRKRQSSFRRCALYRHPHIPAPFEMSLTPMARNLLPAVRLPVYLLDIFYLNNDSEFDQPLWPIEAAMSVPN